MKGNICYECLKSAIGERINQIRAVDGSWIEKCEVCGYTAVFYAREDEIEKAKSLITIKESKNC